MKVLVNAYRLFQISSETVDDHAAVVMYHLLDLAVSCRSASLLVLLKKMTLSFKGGFIYSSKFKILQREIFAIHFGVQLS